MCTRIESMLFQVLEIMYITLAKKKLRQEREKLDQQDVFAILYRYRNLWDRLLGSRCQLISTDMPVSTMSYYSLSLSLTLAASPAAAASLSIICQSCFPKQVLLWSWPFIEYQVGQPASCSRVVGIQNNLSLFPCMTLFFKARSLTSTPSSRALFMFWIRFLKFFEVQ